jgi:guanylate kinase
MQNALSEIEQYHYFNYVIINDNLERARDELAAIILAERCRRQRRTQSVERILRTFLKK